MAETALRRILLVEDDPDIRQVAKLALEALGGFSVLPCGSGPEALAALSASADPANAADDWAPDLILLDVMMPGMDGPETLRALRRIPGAERLPAVFMTARVQAEEVAAYRAMGAADVIAKPFDPMRLAEIVLGIWRALPRSSSTDERKSGIEDIGELDELRRSFSERLGGRVREIAEAWEAARAAPGSPEPLGRLHRLAHSLHGTAGTFGYPAVGDAAYAIERRLKELLDAGMDDGTDIAELAPLLGALQRAAGKLP
jgi:two-component system OmpR family response regulator